MYDERIKIAWHESGHALWGHDSSRRVSMTFGADSTQPHALGYCTVEPRVSNDSVENVEFLLSGLATEKVCCERNGLVYKEGQIEWFEAIDGAWQYASFCGEVSYQSPYDYVKNDKFNNRAYMRAVPNECKVRVHSVFEKLVAKYRCDPRLEALAQEFLRKETMSESEIRDFLEAKS